MGRHSRKGRAKAVAPSERAALDGGSSRPHGGSAPGAPTPRGTHPSAAGPVRGTALPDVPGPPGGGYASPVRGGHPEQRETGGGWGADGTGQGPAGGGAVRGGAVGRVLQGRPGSDTGVRSAGPRQEYLDAFEDDVFAAGAPSTMRAPGRPGGGGAPAPSFGRGPEPRRPGPAGPGGPRPGAYGTNGPGERVPWQRQGTSAEDDDPVAPLDPLPSQGRRTKKGGTGRAVTGVAAAAVTTVLAVVIAGQVTDGGLGPGSRAAGSADADRNGRAGDTSASRSDDKGPGPRAGEPQAAALSYAEKMAMPFPLDEAFKGDGRFRSVSGHDKGPDGDQRLRYRVDIEKGLPLEGDLFAKAVHKTLNDKRSWAHGGARGFERVDSGDTDFVITLASPATTDVWCAKSGLDTSQDRVSCDSAATDRVMINAYRWAQGAKTFGQDRMYAYRQMLINHEVGHRIGRGHVGCPKDGAPAPVMMQQTKYLTTNGATCRPNAWEHPRG